MEQTAVRQPLHYNDITTPQTRRYTTLWYINIQKL